MTRHAGTLVAVCIVLVVTSTRAGAATIYLDTFEAFPAGTSLTTAQYTPAIGGTNAARFGVFPPGAASSVTVVDFGGSRAAQIDLPLGSGEDYLGQFFTSYVEQVIDVQFRFTATAVSAGLGGFFVRFPTPPSIPDGMQLLFGFLNDGNLIVFNDLPVLGDISDVGDYVVGETYDVRLLVDLPGNRYTVFLDGAALPLVTHRGLPPHIDAERVHQFGFDSSETMATAGAAQFVFDDVRVQVPEPHVVAVLVIGIVVVFLRRQRASTLVRPLTIARPFRSAVFNGRRADEFWPTASAARAIARNRPERSAAVHASTR